MAYPIIDSSTVKMEKVMDHLKEELATIRTGMANASMLNRVEVEYYGSPTPLNQIAGISVQEGRILVIKPYDPSSLKAIEKGLNAADLGMAPQNDGAVIRLTVPQLTGDTRKELAKKVDADIILATDPDSDRLGIHVKDIKTGEYIFYTGNMTALLIAEYILSQRKENGTLPKNGAVIKTIVSSNLTDAIAEHYKMHFIETLTGFKYIGEQIRGFEQKHDYEYVFGFEESYGCLVGTHARDKDGIVAVMMLAEAAAYYKKQGLTLWDQMINIYEKYGYYREAQVSIVLKGAEGAEKIKELMENLRANPPKSFGKFEIEAIRDYTTSVRKNMKTGKEEKITLPKSNVLYYELANNEWCCARPSGTEPKVKFYMGVKAKTMEEAEQRLKELKEEVLKNVE